MEILVTDPLDDPEDGFGLQQAVLEEVAAHQRGPAALMCGPPRATSGLPGWRPIYPALP